MKPTKQQIMGVVVPLITLAAGYFGYEPVQELTAPPAQDVDIEVHVPDSIPHHSHPSHTHKTPPQKDWNPVIKSEIKEAVREHLNSYH